MERILKYSEDRGLFVNSKWYAVETISLNYLMFFLPFRKHANKQFLFQKTFI